MLVISTFWPSITKKYGSITQGLSEVRGHVNQALAASPLGPVRVSAMSLSASAIEVSLPGVGCDQYSAKRPLSLLPNSACSANSSSLPSRALGSNTSDRLSSSGLACSADLTWRVRSSRRSKASRKRFSA
ncbi:hypothetical protein D3C73_1156460 [compost metagenome]